MLGQRRRRLANIETALGEWPVFAAGIHFLLRTLLFPYTLMALGLIYHSL